jgi:hypothetical protein
MNMVSSDLPYEARAEGMRRIAEARMLEWLDELPREERDLVLLSPAYGKVADRWYELTAAEKLALVHGELASRSDAGLDEDVANSSRASYVVDMAAALDSLADELQEQFGFDRETAVALAKWDEQEARPRGLAYSDWLLNKVLQRLAAATNAKVASVAVAFALSVPEVWIMRHVTDENGSRRMRRVPCRTQMSAAQALATTRQNLSKEVRKAAEFLGISEGLHMKTPGAVESFRRAQTGNHWRHRVFGWN